MQMPLVLKLSEGLDIFCPVFVDKKTHQTLSAELYVDDRMYVCKKWIYSTFPYP